MRDGLTARGTSPSATNIGAAVLYRANGTKKMLRVVNGAASTSKFQHSDNGGITWTDVTSGGSRATDTVWRFVQANDYIYGVNGTDTPIKYDGNSIATVAAIPNGTCIEWFKNFLWVIGVSATPDRLYFSNAADPETFGGAAYVNVNLGDYSKGSGLKGVGGATGRLYIGKERSVWYLTGTSSSDFAIDPLTYEFGVASHETMIAVKNDVWCIDLDGNVRSLYRSGSSDAPFGGLVSSNIQNTIGALNRTSIRKASAIFHNNYAMFFVPYGVDDRNSIVLVFDTLSNENKGGWIKFTGWNIARAVGFQDSGNQKLILFDSRTGNGQSYEWTGTSDNGTAITAKYETKVYDLGYPDQEKAFKFSYQYAPVVANINMEFYASIDRYYYVKLADVNLLGTGNRKLGQDWRLGIDPLGSGGFVKFEIPFSNYGGSTDGTTAQIKLQASSSTTKIKVRAFTMHYRVRALR